MEFEGLTRDDLANVEALNRAWLRCRGGGNIFAGNLNVSLRDRVATTPFLLFSFRERDDELWRRLLEKRPQKDLLDESSKSTDELHEVQIAGLSFIWTLARCNPYAARIVSIAPPYWCEIMTSTTLMRILECTSKRRLIEPRLETVSMLHREFVQVGALQSLLTTGQQTYDDRIRAAACRAPKIARQVADKV